MIKISQLKLKGFKSFKYANIEFPENFVCLAGPNGSGKSNICDSIRFVMGEKSLRSLRVRKTKDLIFAGSNSAEVMIVFEDVNDSSKKYEIRRAIRTDGKMQYRLNGKVTPKSAITEVLKQYNLDDSGRNIIAQGRIQGIVQMTGRERRGIIENVAGISDFDKKKKEAMKELDAVNSRIKEANIVFGERSARLKELEKEREIAIKYKENKDKLKIARASILKIELKELDGKFQKITEDKLKLKSEIDKLQKQVDVIADEIFELDKKRNEYSSKLKEKQIAMDGVRNIEKLKAEIELKEKLIADRSTSLKKLKEQKENLEKEYKEEEIEAKKLKDAIKSLESELKEYSSKVVDFKSSDKVKLFEQDIESTQEKISDKKEDLGKIEAQIQTSNEVLKLKREQLDEIKEELKSQGSDESDGDSDILESLCADLSKEIASLFDEERKINYKLANIDKESLKLREKAAQLKARSSPGTLNPSLSVIKDLKDSKKVDGIHGTVADLITFDPKYSSAVEASLGGRLMYVVVEDLGVATKLIQILKKMKSGRATFIPLDSVKPKSLDRKKNLLLNYISYDSKVSLAMDFAFSDTVLTSDIKEARSAMKSGSRAVTLDGEVFEKSGILTGGRLSGSLLAGTQIKKLDAQIKELKDDRFNQMQRLEDVRQEGNRKRKEKAEAEVKLKTIEIEKRAFKENRDRIEKLKEQSKEIESKIKSIQKEIDNHNNGKSKITSELESLNKKLTKLKEDLEEEKEKSSKILDDANKEKTEIASKISSLKAQIEGKQKEFSIRESEISKNEEVRKELNSTINEINSEVSKINKELPQIKKSLSENEKRMKESSKLVETLLNNIKSLEAKIKSLSEDRGKLKFNMDSKEKQLHKLDVEEATIKTRLIDLKSEFEEYKEVEFLEMEKKDLLERVKESEKVLNSIEAVNMSAIELFEKKSVEIDELEKKISLLSSEREAILSMMSEIETKKREIFFETYNAINENFQKMLETIPVGSGHLYLDNEKDPFESKLFIKIRKHNRDVSIDSLSGGESSLIALAFIFAIQFYKPSPFYILDEADAALDKQNSNHFAKLVSEISKDTNAQFLAVSHNDNVIERANAILGVTRVDGISKIVGVKLDQNKPTPA